MALIKCPECGRESVSEFAEICPECGFAIRDYFEMHNVDKILINEPSEESHYSYIPERECYELDAIYKIKKKKR